MKIAIDISSVIYETGVSVYTKNLVENLLSVDKENEYVLFGGSLRRSGEIKNWLSSLQGSFSGKVFLIPPVLANIAWNKLHLFPIEKLLGSIDVFHSSDWAQPPSAAFKITTIHDLVPIKYPKLSSSKIVSVHKSRFRWVKKEVDRVIVPSETTKTDLIKLGVEKRKIVVISEAPDPIFARSKKAAVDELKKRFRIPGKYLLAIGVAPRKNLERIIEAYEKVKQGGLKLVIVGQSEMQTHQKRGVIMTGHVAKEDMPVLYSGAEALVYPSLYEGFGLPILEAFVCRLPVVTSNFGSMAEVAGKAAVLVDPYSATAIADGIVKAIRDKSKLIKKGMVRVKKYLWKKAAEMTLDVYKEYVAS